MREELSGDKHVSEANDVEMVTHKETLSRRPRGHVDEEKG